MSKAHDHVEWSAARDGPWPRVRLDGDFDRSQREWVHTNGAGAYSMSTLALMHTRRQHGMLVAALDPPLARHVILSHAETSVEFEGRVYRLSTHQFPNIAPTPGYRLLHEFAQDPIPRWLYRLGRHDFERTVSLVRGENAVVVAYTWHGPSKARLSMRPLLPLRPADLLTREHGAMMQRVTLRPNEVEIQPVLHLPPVIFGHSGVFMGSPDWWRRFEYLEERRLGGDFQEDIWTPGVFEIALRPNRPTYLIISVGSLPARHPSDLVAETVEYLQGNDPGKERPSLVRALSIAAEQFSADACARPSTLAGFPHQGMHTRDALISLSGIYLSRGKIDAAKRVLRALVGLQSVGFLPLALAESGRQRVRPSPDATLWLFVATRELVERTGLDDPLVKKHLYPALVRAFVRLRGRRRRWAWITHEGLLAQGEDGVGLTWMDARSESGPVTPRRGLAVELQALWSAACDVLFTLASHYGKKEIAAAAESARNAARAAFRLRFWCNETYYPYDCIGDARTVDASIRPNALIALAIDPELFEDWQAAAIIERVRADLLTPVGVRSLAPSEHPYRGWCDGTIDEREASYHQGSAWPFLLGCFVRAALRLAPDDPELLRDLEARVTRAASEAPVLGHVAQLGEGDEPFRFRACPAQAWSTAELLRSLVSDLTV